MKYLHTMVRVKSINDSLDFYCDKLGLTEVNRYENEEGRFTLVFLAALGDEEAQVELTYNWDSEDYDEGRNFGHLAYAVDDIYETGITLNTFKDIEGAMFFVLFSKIKPTWWNTVYFSEKSEWIVFPWENTLNSEWEREEYIKKRGLN